MADQYKPGDVVNGHRLTEDNRWVPVSDAPLGSSAGPTTAMPATPYAAAPAAATTSTGAKPSVTKRGWFLPLLEVAGVFRVSPTRLTWLLGTMTTTGLLSVLGVRDDVGFGAETGRPVAHDGELLRSQDRGGLDLRGAALGVLHVVPR